MPEASQENNQTPEVTTPVTAAETPAVETQQSNESSTSPSESSASAGESENNGEGGDKKTPWFQRRIDQLVAEKWEERRRAEAKEKEANDLMTQLAEMRKSANSGQQVSNPATSAGSPPAQRTDTGLSEAELKVRIEREAESLTRQRAFNKSCDETAENGARDYGDFNLAMKTFGLVGGIPQTVLETVIEMPDGHKILYAIGKDPELAEKISKLSPARQALEVGRLEASLKKPVAKPVSNAPAPIKPVDTGSRASDDPEKMSMEEFVVWREKETTKKRR